MSLSEDIRSRALELGFDLVGIARAGKAAHGQNLRRWLDQGHHADMAWMARDPETRIDPGKGMPGARSVIAVGFTYFVQDPPDEIWNDPSRGRISRYAWGQDYHDVLKSCLDKLARFLRDEADQDVQTALYLDSGPLLERDVAVAAGLGFVGRNAQLISPQFGSYVFLGEIVVDIELDYDDACRPGHPTGRARSPRGVPAPAGQARRPTDVHPCGRCTRCLKACPTQSFPDEYVLDSRRCISYLTIEHKGAIPVDLRPLMGNWIFGCDECQSVCPWVKRYSKPKQDFFLGFEPEFAAPRLLELLRLDVVPFRMRFLGSPVMRPKRKGLLRNVCVALGNWGSPEALPELEKAARDPEPLIREHAEWAIQEIEARR